MSKKNWQAFNWQCRGSAGRRTFFDQTATRRFARSLLLHGVVVVVRAAGHLLDSVRVFGRRGVRSLLRRVRGRRRRALRLASEARVGDIVHLEFARLFDEIG